MIAHAQKFHVLLEADDHAQDNFLPEDDFVYKVAVKAEQLNIFKDSSTVATPLISRVLEENFFTALQTLGGNFFFGENFFVRAKIFNQRISPRRLFVRKFAARFKQHIPIDFNDLFGGRVH